MSKTSRAYYQDNLAERRRVELEDLTWLATWWDCEERLETFARYVFTKDEHADGSESIKPFPTRDEKAYVWAYLDFVRTEPIALCEKSRQMMVTWATCLYILWCCKFQRNRLWFIQSKKEEDAANLVFNADPAQARISFMEWHLPEPLRSDVQGAYSKLYFTETGSRAWGIPEGGDQIRSYTPTGLFDDEFAFQPEAESAYKAARPAITGGGQFIGVSTPRGGSYMHKLIAR